MCHCLGCLQWFGSRPLIAARTQGVPSPECPAHQRHPQSCGRSCSVGQKPVCMLACVRRASLCPFCTDRLPGRTAAAGASGAPETGKYSMSNHPCMSPWPIVLYWSRLTRQASSSRPGALQLSGVIIVGCQRRDVLDCRDAGRLVCAGQQGMRAGLVALCPERGAGHSQPKHQLTEFVVVCLAARVSVGDLQVAIHSILKGEVSVTITHHQLFGTRACRCNIIR